jgi:hypothetical protein
MIDKCDRCGMTNVEVMIVKSENGKQEKLCNQCRPADGAYAYWQNKQKSPPSYVIPKFLDIQISDNNDIIVFKSISNTI